MKFLIPLFLCLYAFSVNAERWSEFKNFSRLLHYQNGQGLVKDADFYLSIKGKNNIAEEIKALKEAYNKPKSLANKHPRCLFPDRYFWLSKQVKLDQYEIYPSFCKELQKYHQDNPLKSISILLVSGYFANPASVFGHNLLKFNGKNNDLFDATLNFGAKIPKDETTILYIAKGLFGGYDARFTNQAFYKRDLVYSKNELRDIWDYELNLSADELTLIKLHIWSIKSKLFEYYFLKENCSYQIASIVDLVIDMDLPKYKQWYIPVELTNQISKNQDRVKHITYRPSTERKLFKQFASLNEEEKSYIEAFMQNNFFENSIKIEETSEITALNILIDYYNNLLIDNNKSDFSVKRDRALMRRLQLSGQAETIINIDSIAPHNYPDLSVLSLYADKDNFYSEFSIFNNSLLGEHSLDNSELIAPRITLFSDKKNRVKLHSLDIVKIIKLNNRLKNYPHQNISWEVQFGVKNINNKIKPSATIGVGKVLFSNKNTLLYSMISALVNQTNDRYSSKVSLNIINKNFLGNFLVSNEFNLKEKKLSTSYKWQKQLTKNYSLFLSKLSNDNTIFGINYYF